MKGEQLDDAVAFALAFKEQTSRNLDDPSQLERQRKLEAAQKTQREEAEKTAEARSVERRAEEARLVDAEARAKTAPPARSFEADFLSRRISGMSRDEAARAAREASGRNRRPVAPPVATPTTQRRLRTPTPAPAPTPTPAPTVAPTPAPTPERRADPSNPAFEYQPTAAGDYIVFRDGVRTGRAVKGSRAFRSIESVLSGGQPLARPPAPPPGQVFELPAVEIRGTPPAAASFGRRPGETDEQYERRLLGE